MPDPVSQLYADAALTDCESADGIAINNPIGNIANYTLPIVLVNEEYLPVERKNVLAER
jgi:hypothetical protein